MMIYHRSRTITLVIVTFAMAMPLSASEYPCRWPALKETPAGKCASLSGVYEYYGEWGNSGLKKQYGPPMIDGSIFHRPPARGCVAYLDHDMKRGVLHFRIVGGYKDRGSCEERMIFCERWLVQPIDQSGYGEGTQVDTKGTIRLARAKDGSLVVHDQEEIKFRYFFIFNSSESYEGRYRFRPVNEK
jgi:hypothetical protein